MDETLTWKYFYGIEDTAAGYIVYSIDQWEYLATCGTYEEAEKQAKKYFEGLKKIWT